MRKDIGYLIYQLDDAYKGNPWFGRCLKEIIGEVNLDIALQKPGGDQHSLLELLWHIITWREFTISRLETPPTQNLQYFDENDWRELDHSDNSLWQKGLDKLDETQQELLQLLQQADDSILDKNVEGRKFNFRYLLNGIIQHDIYHLGQIAYVKKLLVKTQ